ncbi:MAG: Ty1/Copia family ribonuclease HI, partial [Actinobacteria bacterium]|nr:Ty1/Copia family ribonuclease HI [Actinomycetota bacterium]
LGRFDIATAVMTMLGFRVAPREGHLERVRRICGYLAKMKHGFLRIHTEEPDYSDLPDKQYDWSRSVYGDVKEQVQKDAPRPLGKRVVLTSYVDANLHHDLVTGRSVTGALHFVNQTPILWYSKKQPTMETATYGSEFVAAKLAVEQIMAMRLTLRYLGVEVHGPTHLFGDNGSVVTSSSVPESPLRKRHQALAYHYTREAIASNAVNFRHLPGDLNPADILSKHWGYAAIWQMLRTVMFWTGNPSSLLVDATPHHQQEGSEKCPASMASCPEATRVKTGETGLDKSSVEDFPTVTPLDKSTA